jgi:glycine/D-amino acid oxidase-like deaminating enzyme
MLKERCPSPQPSPAGRGRRLAGVLVLAAAAWAAGAATPAPVVSEEFFIVSSVDSGKGSMVVKRPTEVTLTIGLTEKTRCRDEQGKAIRATDLRAGDTVFIGSDRNASGQPVAASIRRGPMTVPELHRRYLRF